MSSLANMRMERSHFLGESFRNINEMIWRVMCHNPNFFYSPWFKTFGFKVSEGKRISCVGIDRLNCCFASSEMVWMRCADAIPITFWRLDQHSIWFFLANYFDDIASKFNCWSEPTIAIVKKGNISNSERFTSVALFPLSNCWHLFHSQT